MPNLFEHAGAKPVFGDGGATARKIKICGFSPDASDSGYMEIIPHLYQVWDNRNAGR